MNTYKEIPVGPYHKAKVDSEDFEYLNQFTWSYLKGGYAFRRTSKKLGTIKSIYMHREILNTPIGMDTDHINGDGLDNRKVNIRICTTAQNLANRGVITSRNKSGYKGVYWNGKKWIAQIGRRTAPQEHANEIIGKFDSPIEAAKAYDGVLYERFGEFAKLNFEIGG